jgi:hypothetical protein
MSLYGQSADDNPHFATAFAEEVMELDHPGDNCPRCKP